MEEMQDTWWDCSDYLYTIPQSQEKFLSFMNIEALKNKPTYFMCYICVFRVVNVYYHCVVDANPRFKNSFSLRVETLYSHLVLTRKGH